MKTENCYRIKHTDTSGLQYFDVEVLGKKSMESYLNFIEYMYGQRTKENAKIEEYVVNIYQ